MHKLTSMRFHGSTATSHKKTRVSFERCAGFLLNTLSWTFPCVRQADKMANKGRKDGMSERRLKIRIQQEGIACEGGAA